MSGISKSQVSAACATRSTSGCKTFLDRPIEGDWPYLWIDATYVKVRQAGRIVSVAVIIAVGVNTDGRREVLGMDIGPSEAETFWTEFLRTLARRGLRGVKLVISDAHEGLKAAVAKVLHATWQRCRVHFHAQRAGPCRQEQRPGRRRLHRHRLCPGRRRRSQGTMAQGRRSAPAQAAQARRADGRGRGRRAGLHGLPRRAPDKLHSTNPLERLNGEIKRRTDVVGIFPNEAAIIRLVGAILLEQNDEWAVQRARYMTLETIATLSDDPTVSLPAWPSDSPAKPENRGDPAAATPRHGTRSCTDPRRTGRRALAVIPSRARNRPPEPNAGNSKSAYGPTAPTDSGVRYSDQRRSKVVARKRDRHAPSYSRTIFILSSS